MSRSTRVATCQNCQVVRIIRARGLCNPCYVRCRQQGALDDFERATRPRHELIEDWQFLAAQGYSRAQAAERLGITKARLEKAIARENRARMEAVA